MFDLKKNVTIFIMFFLGTSSVLGYVSESPNYRMEKDSINFGGTENSISSNYSLSDTLGELASGELSGLLYGVKSGYRATDGNYTITISAPDNISLVGLTTAGGQSEGEGSWTITTDNPGGYLLYISAESEPALQSNEDSFADYSPAITGVPDLNWAIDTDASEFGFTVFGSDTTVAFKDNGLVCNTGTNISTDRCWDSLSTSDHLIASGSNANSPSGAVTSIKLKAEIGSGKNQTVGTYSANLTITALSQ